MATDRRDIRARHDRYGDALPKAEIMAFYEEVAYGTGALDDAARALAVETRKAMTLVQHCDDIWGDAR